MSRALARGRVRPDADVDELAPLVSWPECQALMGYRFDEHVTIIGPPGRGKTTLAIAGILPMRRNVVVLVTKSKDKPLERLLREGHYRRVRQIPNVAVARRVFIWPKHSGIGDVKDQAVIMAAAFDQVYAEGNRALYCDEVHYFAEFLHMAPRLKLAWQQGRSSGVSLVAGFQRPAWVPRDAYASATHLFIFGTADGEDARALGGIGGLNSAVIRHVVAWLADDRSRRHQFLYVNTRTGVLVRSQYR